MSYPITTKTDFTRAEMAALIDHSLLVPYTTEAEMDRFLLEVRDNGFKVACVNNCFTKKAAEFFKGTDIKVATVVAFPFGSLDPASKAAEVKRSIALGAGTIDIVSNIGAIKSHDWISCGQTTMNVWKLPIAAESPSKPSWNAVI